MRNLEWLIRRKRKGKKYCLRGRGERRRSEKWYGANNKPRGPVVFVVVKPWKRRGDGGWRNGREERRDTWFDESEPRESGRQLSWSRGPRDPAATQGRRGDEGSKPGIGTRDLVWPRSVLHRDRETYINTTRYEFVRPSPGSLWATIPVPRSSIRSTTVLEVDGFNWWPLRLNQCREWRPQLRKIFVERDTRKEAQTRRWLGKNRKRVLWGEIRRKVPKSKFLGLCNRSNRLKSLSKIWI